jgi:hypothetical protein
MENVKGLIMINHHINSPMSFSSMFSQPLLIFDDKCSSCAKFAKAAARLSRGWIRIAGHYYSQEAIDTKKVIFPQGYDPTKMFWLINRKGAYGARLGLNRVLVEIIRGNVKSICKAKHTNRHDNNNDNFEETCSDNDKESCMSTKNTLSRIFNMLKSGDKINF